MMGTFVAGSMMVYVAAAAITARVTGRLFLMERSGRHREQRKRGRI